MRTDETTFDEPERSVIDTNRLDRLIHVLRRRGYRVIGPTVRDGAVIYDDLESAAALPVGVTERQDRGSYRLEQRSDGAFFGFAGGAHSWKRFLFPPRVRLWSARTDGDAPQIELEPLDPTPLAFVGVRACELRAIQVQDRIFLGGTHVDRDYAARRQGLFVVAVDCFEPGGTCFCTSMGTGPEVGPGHDLALTELIDGEHRFLVEAGSPRGVDVLRELDGRVPTADDLTAAHASVQAAAARMGRTLETDGLRELLAENLEHPRWEDVAARCLACGNCTLVCPTCFCSSVEDTASLAGDVTQRDRVWDNCFSLDYSYIHGGSIRPSGRSRYRQWMTHKLGTWFDQFGTSGCVGCGRCITWCPVGIDITEEAAAIRATEGCDAASA